MKGILAVLGKVLGIASIGEAISGLHLARKFVIDIALIIMLVIIGSMMAGAFCIAALYETYEALLRHGLDADMAALTTAGLSILVLGSLVAVVAYKIRKMQSFPFSFANSSFPGSSLQSVVKGFYQGLTHKNPF